MGNQPIEEQAQQAVSDNGEPEENDTKSFDGFDADVHGHSDGRGGHTWNRTWADRLGVGAKDSDFAPIPSTRELLAQADYISSQREPAEVSANRAARYINDEDPVSINALREEAGLPQLPDDLTEEGLRGSVWRLDQRTTVTFARAQGAFIIAQNEYMYDKDVAKMARAQHVFIEAQAEVLAKFGVV